jgi:hypothetical protein
MGSRSFVVNVFHEDLGKISNFLMFTNLQLAFVMFLLCYAQCCGYLLCIDCCPYILGMLNTNRSCNCYLFLIGQSPHSSG